jgi:hypothetical protein
MIKEKKTKTLNFGDSFLSNLVKIMCYKNEIFVVDNLRNNISIFPIMK